MANVILPDWYGQLRTLKVRNTAAEEAPAFAVLRMTGNDADGVITVAKPNADHLTMVMINGPGAIPAGKYGEAHYEFPIVALYNPGTPTFNAQWGSVNGQWYLGSGKRGFRALGIVDADRALGMFCRNWAPGWTAPLVMTDWECDTNTNTATLTHQYICEDGTLSNTSACP